MPNFSTPLPQGPAIKAPATTNIGSSIPVPSQSYTPTFGQKVISGLSNLAGSVTGSGLLGSAVGVLGNLIGDTINYRRQKKMYDQQREDALEDYATQRADYLYDLADERAYNSPLAQVARLKQAGINPNVAFGSGSPANTTETATNQSGIRSAQVPSVSGSALGDSAIRGASGLIQSSMAGVQAQQLQQDIALKKAQAINVLSESRLTASKEIRQKIENSFLDSLFAADIAEKQARTNQLIDSLETAALARLSSTYDLYHLKPAQKAQVEASIAQYYANIRSINQQTSYFDSVKNIRQRNEIIDMKRNSYQMAVDHLRRDLVKELGAERGNSFFDRLIDDFFILQYGLEFK